MMLDRRSSRLFCLFCAKHAEATDVRILATQMRKHFRQMVKEEEMMTEYRGMVQRVRL